MLAMPCYDDRAHQEEDRSSFLVGTQPMKSQGLFVYYNPPPTSFFSLLKWFPSLATGVEGWGVESAGGSPRLQTPKFQFSPDPK